MADYTSLEALFMDLQKKINESLVDEVKDVAIETLESEEQNSVYGAYNNPDMQYKRRYSNDGLLDERNIDAKLIADGVLRIQNNAPVNEEYNLGQSDMSLAEMIVKGIGYDYPLNGNRDYPYSQPRDFISATEEDLRQTNAHISAMINGLRKRGFEVK